MKILIISAYFPQQNSIASLRAYSWAKWFTKMGHEVTVLTTEKISLPNDLRLDCSVFKVITYPFWMPFQELRSELKSNIQKEYQKKLPLKLMIFGFAKGIYQKFQSTTGCFSACRYPDWHDLWARKAYKKVKDITWDLVVSSGGPYSVHRIGMALKVNEKAKKWVIDWRDLWTKNHLYHGIFLFHPFERYLERKFHKNADLITTVSEPLADILRGITKTRVEVIYNGFDPDDFSFLESRPRKENKKLEIVYTGTIYRGFRDPSPLFEAVGCLLKEEILSGNDVQITFAGPPQTDVKDLADRYGARAAYNYAGFLPREKALELQYDADVCLFLEHNNPSVRGVLTGKIFEYLYIAREIWAIGITGDSTAGALIEKNGVGIVFGTDVRKIKDYIVKRIRHKKTVNLTKNFPFMENFSRKKQALKLLELIGG